MRYLRHLPELPYCIASPALSIVRDATGSPSNGRDIAVVGQACQRFTTVSSG
jgi:hypothetical protein